MPSNHYTLFLRLFLPESPLPRLNPYPFVHPYPLKTAVRLVLPPFSRFLEFDGKAAVNHVFGDSFLIHQLLHLLVVGSPVPQVERI